MSSFPTSSVIVEQLGWVLLHSLWQFAVIVILAHLTMRLLNRQSATARYAVLTAAMTFTVLMPAFTWLLLDVSSLESPLPRSLSDKEHDTTLASGSLSGDARFPDVFPEVAATGVSAEMSGVTSDVRPEAAWTQRATMFLKPWLAWIVACWSIGCMLCAMRPLLGWYMLGRLRRVGVSDVPEGVVTAAQRLAERLGLSRRVRVLHSTLARVPIVVGYFRPVILLPVSLVTSIPATQLEAILAHELAHVRRHDFLVNLLQILVETVFFYHPAVWWLSSRLRAEREYCCDQLVVSTLGDPAEYGRALLAVEELRGADTVFALSASGGRLPERVRRILGMPLNAGRHSSWPALPGFVGVVAVCAISLFFGLQSLAQSSGEASKEQTGQRANSAEPSAATPQQIPQPNATPGLFPFSAADADAGTDEDSAGWENVHINVTYLQSQHKLVEPVFPELSALFPRREPIAIPDKALPRMSFHIQITHDPTNDQPSWTLIHDKGGSFLLATDTKQLSAALVHLNRIAKKEPLDNAKRDEFPHGIPIAVRLPLGITTSMPTSRLAPVAEGTESTGESTEAFPKRVRISELTPEFDGEEIITRFTIENTVWLSGIVPKGRARSFIIETGEHEGEPPFSVFVMGEVADAMERFRYAPPQSPNRARGLVVEARGKIKVYPAQKDSPDSGPSYQFTITDLTGFNITAQAEGAGTEVMIPRSRTGRVVPYPSKAVERESEYSVEYNQPDAIALSDIGLQHDGKEVTVILKVTDTQLIAGHREGEYPHVRLWHDGMKKPPHLDVIAKGELADALHRFELVAPDGRLVGQTIKASGKIQIYNKDAQDPGYFLNLTEWEKFQILPEPSGK